MAETSVRFPALLEMRVHPSVSFSFCVYSLVLNKTKCPVEAPSAIRIFIVSLPCCFSEGSIRVFVQPLIQLRNQARDANLFSLISFSVPDYYI